MYIFKVSKSCIAMHVTEPYNVYFEESKSKSFEAQSLIEWWNIRRDLEFPIFTLNLVSQKGLLILPITFSSVSSTWKMLTTILWPPTILCFLFIATAKSLIQDMLPSLWFLIFQVNCLPLLSLCHISILTCTAINWILLLQSHWL